MVLPYVAVLVLSMATFSVGVADINTPRRTRTRKNYYPPPCTERRDRRRIMDESVLPLSFPLRERHIVEVQRDLFSRSHDDGDI